MRSAIKPGILFFVIGGVSMFLGFVFTLFFMVAANRSVISGMNHAITVTGPTATEIMLDKRGIYEINYASYIFTHASEFDDEALLNLYISLTNKSNNNELLIRPSTDGNTIEAKTDYCIREPGVYSLEIGYLNQSGPDVEVIIKSNNSVIYETFGLCVTIVFLAAGLIIVLVTAIKRNKAYQRIRSL